MNVDRVGKGAIWSMITITAITILAELAKPLKDVLAAATGHHWVTKSMLAIIVFLAIALTGKKKALADKDASLLGMRVIGTAIVCIIILFAFFVWEFVK